LLARIPAEDDLVQLEVFVAVRAGAVGLLGDGNWLGL
jgi:hypothetical protein